jgi:hypothetical protein
LELSRGLHVIKYQLIYFATNPARAVFTRLERQEIFLGRPFSKRGRSGFGAAQSGENEGEMMKNRRLTILCVALVALAGTPRAWQEAGKLLAAIQHKAQVRFWSMVAQPKTRETAGTELLATVRPSNLSPAGFDSNCPLNHIEFREKQATASFKTGRRIASASVQPKATARLERSDKISIAPTSHAALIAEAYKALPEDIRLEELRHLGRIQKHQSPAIAESRPTPPAVPPTVAASSLTDTATAASKAENFRFVVIPEISPVASALVEKENVVQFRMLRKALEDNKLTRQKNRLPVSRGAAAFPSI